MPTNASPSSACEPVVRVRTNLAQVPVITFQQYQSGSAGSFSSNTFRAAASTLSIGLYCGSGGTARTAHVSLIDESTHSMVAYTSNLPCDGAVHHDTTNIDHRTGDTFS